MYEIKEKDYFSRKKTASTTHAGQSGHGFNWDHTRVLHHVNSYNKCMFLESLYIILKTNTINDKSANFPPIYHNILKHEWKLSVTWLPWVCHLMDRFSSYGFVNSPLKFITIFDRYLTHTFTIFTALLYLVMFFTFLCNFCSISFRICARKFPGVLFYTSRFLSHTVTHFL